MRPQGKENDYFRYQFNIMTKIDLSKYGIKGVTEILYNPTYEVLFNEETKPGLEGYDKGQVTELGAINVMTGVYTGRSPKDKYIVMDKNSKDTVWWNTPEYPNDNHELSEKVWKDLKNIATKELSGKRLFVVDGFCGISTENAYFLSTSHAASFFLGCGIFRHRHYLLMRI